MQSKAKRLIIATVVFNVLISVMASDMYLPSLPAMAHALLATHTEIKLTLTLYFVGFCLSQLIYGPMSDAFGRRKVILAGLLIVILGSFICSLSSSIAVLIIGRFIQGCGTGAGFSLSRAIMRDAFEGKEISRVASITSNFTAFIPAAAPVIGGYLQHYIGWHANFVLLLILSIFCIAFVYRFFVETNLQKDRSAIHPKTLGKNYYHLFINRRFMALSICSGVVYGTLFMYLALSPFLFQNILHLNPIAFGWLGVFTGTGLILGTYVNMYLLKRLSMHKIIFVGIVMTAIAAVLMGLPCLFSLINIVAIIIPVIVLLLACKLLFINIFALALHDLKHIAGTAGALYSMIQILGPIVGTAIASLIHIKTQLPIAIIFFTAFLLMLMLYFFGHSNAKKAVV